MVIDAVVLATISCMRLVATEIRVNGTPPLQTVPWVDYAWN
jgi:hypothetical protein